MHQHEVVLGVEHRQLPAFRATKREFHCAETVRKANSCKGLYFIKGSVMNLSPFSRRRSP
jgi:hypothetical protein